MSASLIKMCRPRWFITPFIRLGGAFWPLVLPARRLHPPITTAKPPLISERIIGDVKAAYSSRSVSIRVAHRVLDKATLLAINTAAHLSPLTKYLPNQIHDFMRNIPIFLLKWTATARANCAVGFDMPSLEALRETVLSLRTIQADSECAACAGGLCGVHDELAYHWYVLVENAAVLQFSLLYFDKINSAWEAFRACWGEKFLIRGANGKTQSPPGSLTTAISDTARDDVLVAA